MAEAAGLLCVNDTNKIANKTQVRRHPGRGWGAAQIWRKIKEKGQRAGIEKVPVDAFHY